jgi:hypothetical protein
MKLPHVFTNLLRVAVALMHVCLGISPLFAADRAPLKAAIFVENRAGKDLEGKADVLEDLLSARIAGRGFALISRQNAIEAINRSGGGTDLDKYLNSRSSALRLAQNLGADVILKVSLTTYGVEKKAFKSETVETVNATHNLRVGYQVLEANEAGSLAGDTVKVSKTLRTTAGSSTESSDILNDLLDEAAEKLAATLPQKRGAIPDGLAKAENVELTIICAVTDLVQQPLGIPDIRVTEDGRVLRSTNTLDVQLLDVTVELNGTVIGSAPGTFKVPPHLNKIRLSREGFAPWERTINVVQGQKLRVALQLSEQGYQRWKDSTTYLTALEAGKKLTQAEVTAIEGFAQMLRQSGYKVDRKSDEKADVKAQGKSLFDGATIDALKKLF